MYKIELDGGKYTVQHDNGTNFKALRNGESWRDLTGDGMVLAMAQRIEALETFVRNIATPYSEPLNSVSGYRDLPSRKGAMGVLREEARRVLEDRQ